MTKNKIFSISFSLILIMTLLLGLATTPVMADSVYSLDDGWEGESAGSTSGTSGYFEYEEVAPNINQEFRVSSSYEYNGDRSFQVYCDGVDNDLGYWNLTNSFEYINQINFTVYAWDISPASGELHMGFYNSSGRVLDIAFDDVDSDIEYTDAVGAEHDLCDYNPNSQTKRLHFLITHNETNTIRYQVWNETWVEKCDVTGTSNYASTWTSFSYIKFSASDTPESSLYFDDFNITAGSAGQDEGEDSSNYHQRCNGGYDGYLNLDEQYVEHYIQSFGNVEIEQVELFISLDQYQYVSNDEDDYYMFLNGIDYGSADVIYQYNSQMYIVKWDTINLDIGSNDINLEFNSTASCLVDGLGDDWLYWYKLPITDDQSTYGGSTYHDTDSWYGNGYQNGIPFSTTNPDMGIRYCLYYSYDEDATLNTYDLTLLSNDPHEQGNVTTIDVDVTGTDDYWHIFRTPSDYVVDMKSHFGSGNGDAIVSHTLPPNAEIGEWTFYVCDRDLFVYPLLNWDDLDTYGTNITFNVSDGSSGFGEWYLAPYQDNVELNGDNGVYVIAPEGVEFTVFVYRPDEIIYCKSYVGIGNGSNLVSTGWFIDCDTEGKWDMFLVNSSNPNNIQHRYASFWVGAVDQNTLSIRGSVFCAGETIYFNANYLSSVGSIEVILDSEHSYSIGIYQGVYTWSWTIPNDAIGEWTAYLADSSGTKIQGTNIYFESLDCEDGDGGGGGDDDGTDDANEWADDIISDEFNPYIGAIITGVFLCIPFGLSAQNGMEFPTFGYGFFAVLGLSVSTALGFFPMWIIYALTVVFIASVVIIFVRR